MAWLHALFLIIACCGATPLISTEATVIDSATKDALVNAAALARRQAYAPYSQFRVGAALLTGDGAIVCGCNVENASYGLTCCAERVAVFKAVAEGHRQIRAIAVVVPGGGTPCGACRQVLNEFNPQLPILLGDEEGRLVSETSLDVLLPDAFGPHNLR